MRELYPWYVGYKHLTSMGFFIFIKKRRVL
jgi:hypothetical protein